MSIWKKTLDLRYKGYYGDRDFESDPRLSSKWLQQKEINIETGQERWVDIEIEEKIVY